MAVALGKNDNAAAARDRPALRGLQAIVLSALRFLDRPTHAFKNAPCQHDCLKARDISELFRGSLGLLLLTLIACQSDRRPGYSGPIIDPQGVDIARYQSDLSECQDIADQVHVGAARLPSRTQGSTSSRILTKWLNISS